MDKIYTAQDVLQVIAVVEKLTEVNAELEYLMAHGSNDEKLVNIKRELEASVRKYRSVVSDNEDVVVEEDVVEEEEVEDAAEESDTDEVEEEVVVRKEHTKKVVDSVGLYATMLNEFKYLVEDSCSNDKFERLKFKAINSDVLLPTQKSGIVDRVNNYLNGTYKK
jgi:hypothetical protein